MKKMEKETIKDAEWELIHRVTNLKNQVQVNEY